MGNRFDQKYKDVWIYPLTRREIQISLLWPHVKHETYLSASEKIAYLLSINPKHVRGTRYIALRKLGFPKKRSIGRRNGLARDYEDLYQRVCEIYNLHNLTLDEIINLDFNALNLYSK